ncbi:TfoX/Sxy family protein [Arsenicicoccus sp. oral taxon 190]|uniref:TfoX/Sxy family protein n=1 Tax=Arsenicicoccus sp. oral taxon 190 TaxID=1658671 RepID=UPI00067A0801|nr:TfoX/Sxy family protein [Arsenicicoccus sp. oral taxon 190]AKT52329.1 RNA methyltransferase [Arsenicicoccus sp. oral taxon 190]
MAYDETLAARIRAQVQDDLDVTEKKMFGGLAFLASGNMAVAAISRGGLMLRCDPEEADRLVAADGVSRMVMQGREMHNWLVVDDRTLASEEGLREWVAVGLDFARSLPAK